jgi:hypothetical protein
MNPLCRLFSRRPGAAVIVLFCMVSCLLVAGAGAADVYSTGYLGDVIDLQGYSYHGTQVFLFMTGPGLPADGVTLTDVSQRADQGQFTIIDLDSSQHWSFKWDTSRIWNDIDPGTYLVYVSTEPVDYSHLGGSDTYKTLSVYLKDPGTRTGTGGSTSYSLNPEKHVSTPEVTLPAVQSVVITTPTVPTPVTQPTTLVPPVVSTSAAAMTPTQAAVPPITAIFAVLAGTGLILYRATHR